MKNVIKISIAALAIVLSTAACTPVNKATVGKANMAGIDLAVACNMDGALQSVQAGLSSDVDGYRRISYELKAAIHKELGQTKQVEETVQLFKNDKNLSDKDEAKFLTEVDCFQEYLDKERLKKTNRKTCS